MAAPTKEAAASAKSEAEGHCRTAVTSKEQQQQQQQQQPHFQSYLQQQQNTQQLMAFQTPTIAPSTIPFSRGIVPQPEMMENNTGQPEFVLFEFGATSNSAIFWPHQQPKAAKMLETKRVDSEFQPQLGLPSTSVGLTIPPFRPMSQSALFAHQRKGHRKGMEAAEHAQIRFMMIQVSDQQHHNRQNQQQQQLQRRNSSLSSSNCRLFFDNPMFRKLPNWHFYGDDRALVRIPKMIPLLPIPVERTLLSITPSPIWVRQLLLSGTLSMENNKCCSFGQAAIEYEGYGSDKLPNVEWSRTEEDGVDEVVLSPTCLLNSDSEGQLPDNVACPSSSGVESMSSSDDSTSIATEGCTPVRAMSPNDDDEMEKNCNGNSVTGGNENTSSSANSSTPNSPPTFDRRIVRMSRTKRDAVLRLSMSRNCDDQNCTAGDCDFSGNSSEFGNTSCSSFYQISCMDVLSEHIFNFKQNTEQSTLELNRKLILRDQLYYAISPIFPMCGLYIVGSSLNGFGTKHSDLDLCLMITNRDIDQRSDAVVVLSSVMRTLENFSLVVDQQLILAKVPILRIKCGSAYEGIVIDLNVNNSVAIRNTHLMSYYSAFDWRVRPIVMVVKEWAKCRGINNASHSSFTSYSLVLMVIHYLQCGTDPPVLPSLQKIYPNRFSEKTDVRLLNISQPLDPLPCAVWSFDQGLTLSELLLGFLRYYAYNFNFDTDAISIRTGKKVNRAQVAQNQSPFNTLSQWHCICIEEPFTLSNAAHSVYDQRIFNYIKESFMKSYTELEKHRDLDQFLTKPSEEDGLRLVMPLPQQIMMIPNDKVGDEPITPTNYCL